MGASESRDDAFMEFATIQSERTAKFTLLAFLRSQKGFQLGFAGVNGRA
jgi:hypothetical protein